MIILSSVKKLLVYIKHKFYLFEKILPIWLTVQLQFSTITFYINKLAMTFFRTSDVKEIIFYQQNVFSGSKYLSRVEILSHSVGKFRMINAFLLQPIRVFENNHTHTAQKIRFSIKDYFSKCDQIRSFMWICSHLQKKSLTGNFIFCAVPTWYNISNSNLSLLVF